MLNGANNNLQQFKPARIRMIVAGVLEMSASDDVEINDERLVPLLAEVSRIMEREIVLPSPKPKNGWQMRTSRLASYIYEHQSEFTPLHPSPEPENNKP